LISTGNDHLGQLSNRPVTPDLTFHDGRGQGTR